MNINSGTLVMQKYHGKKVPLFLKRLCDIACIQPDLTTLSKNRCERSQDFHHGQKFDHG